MNPFLSSRRRLLLGVLVLAGLAAGIGVYWFHFRKKVEPVAALPEPGTPRYQEYVEAFQIGVAALDVDQEDRARKYLDKAIDLIPQEPAAWADRGLLHLRKSRPKEAARDLQHAHELAPDSGAIDRLLGLLAEKSGKFDEAVSYLRKAREKYPQDMLVCFSLAELVERADVPGGKKEAQRLLSKILKVLPNNLYALSKKLQLDVRLRDTTAVRADLDHLKRLAPNWTASSREKLAELEGELRNGISGDALASLGDLVNLLKVERGYVRDARTINPTEQKAIGESIGHFLKLKPFRPSPAPADRELTFTAEPLPGGQDGAGWAVVLPFWPTDKGSATVLAADSRQVKRVDGDGLRLTFPSGAKSVPPAAAAVLAIDWKNDFRSNLLLAGAGGLRFFEQAVDGSFKDVSAKTKLDKDVLDADYFGIWAADVEMDGDLDVVVAPRMQDVFVLRNNRDGTFKKITPFPGVTGARAFAWVDLDNDGAPDAVFLDSRGRLHVFANERGGFFRRRVAPEGLGTLLALAVADTNDDGVLDLAALTTEGRVMRISDQDQGKGWQTGALASWPDFEKGAEPGSYRLLTADLDNNGVLDLIASGARTSRIWMGEDAGKFAPLPAAPKEAVFAAVDLTGDGRLDLLALSADGKPLRLVNHGKRAYHWEVVRARGDPKGSGDDRINSFAVGGEVEVRTGTLVQKQMIVGPVIHLGLGERKTADVLRFVWPNGVAQVEFAQEADQTVVAKQRLSGSCPYLFADDGTGMQFVTDFLWSTPLGLNINGQPQARFVQTTEWVRVRGDQLVPREGFYDLRVTGNLWEAHYYDHLSLLVVDHPPGTEMFVDERCAGAPAPPAVILTGPTRPVARARDHHGQDVTEVVRRVDERYLDTFGRGRFQGVTHDHWVEVELGADAPKEGPLWLVAHGWTHPTDSSINVAMSQGQHEQPRGLALEVPDGRGGWKVAQANLGFPAGKNKTMLIRLDGIVGAGPVHHFRLRTNLEIFWDALHYARGVDGKAEQRQLAPASAELRYLGFLQMTQANASSPELPAYDKLEGKNPCWRDLIGYYTRHGDVRPLLAQTDDRYVIMNAGDEIALRFRAPEGPRPGWKRDFVWVSDGWTKDGNLNTGFSKTVLPLPAHGMKSYNRPPGRLEDDPVYQRFPQDWREYHTRYVTPDLFAQGLRSFRRPRP